MSGVDRGAGRCVCIMHGRRHKTIGRGGAGGGFR